MVVGDLYIVDVALLPTEAEAPLVVDPDAVLTLAIPLQGLRQFAGGTRRSCRLSARFSILSFRRELRWMSGGIRRTGSRLKSASASRDRNDQIMSIPYAG